ncbi:MAG: insulinase family protein [Planctomycetales bacterium]|nr:insulinase family protein [Planctomycetales bacterium]
MLRSTVLENGLRIVTEEIPGARSTAIGVLVDASPQDDPAGKEGLAHFVEHGLFQGTTSRDAQAISAMIDEAGGQMTAFTSRDYTCYYAHIMDDYSTFAWELLGDILLNSTFDEASIARERDVVVQELSLQEDDYSGQIHDIVKNKIWNGHPLGREIAGNIASVQSLTRDDCLNFVRQHYTPDRLIVAAAGAAQHERMVEQASDALWRLTGTATPRKQSNCDFTTVTHYEHRDVARAYFNIAIPSLCYADPHRYATHGLNVILGGGMSSRLYSQLRESMGAVYYVHSQYYAYRDAGIMMIEGATSDENLERVLQAIVLELDQLAQDGVTDDELWRTRKQMKGQHLLAGDSMSTRMSRILTQNFYFGDFVPEQEILDAIDGIDGAAIQQQAAAVFESGNIAVGVVGPDTSANGQTRILDTLHPAGFFSQLAVGS